MVMQEPIIFNYSILENILYGKSDATNEEVLNACKLANCMEFIDNKESLTFDDSAGALIKEMETNKDKVIALIGKEKYEEEMEVLRKVDENDQKKGKFVSVAGDVDKRPEELKNCKLSSGFESLCGIRG